MFHIIQQVLFVAAGVAMLVSSAFSSMFVSLCSYVEKNLNEQRPEGEAERSAWLNNRRSIERDRRIAAITVIGLFAVIVIANLVGGGPASMRILFFVGGFINLMIAAVRSSKHDERLKGSSLARPLK